MDDGCKLDCKRCEVILANVVVADAPARCWAEVHTGYLAIPVGETIPQQVHSGCPVHVAHETGYYNLDKQAPAYGQKSCIMVVSRDAALLMISTKAALPVKNKIR